jgi:5-methylcytosine-specific restriction enzyme subunit McrC
LSVEAAPDADLRLAQSSLVDFYLDAFLTAVEHLVHDGLSKRYRFTEGNLYKLKGRIQFAQQVRRNLLHRERMFTAHQVYDRDNAFNRILKCALRILGSVAVRPSLQARSNAALLWFEEVGDARITADTFERLRFDRNTERYRRAIQLARLIIMNYTPDLRGGNEHVIAILFDMNVLFERFILMQLHRASAQFGGRQLRVVGQVFKRFWSNKTIRPDIVASFDCAPAMTKVILDTKWKIPKNGQPADDDLKQMFTYNVHVGAQRSLLIYPRASSSQEERHDVFASSSALPAGYQHSCGMCFVDLFDSAQRLRKDIGAELARRILNG